MIFFFSGTGNTKWAAQTIAEALGERLIDMAKQPAGQTYTLESQERIGFCFPVHGWRVPSLVRNYLRQLTIENASGHYCYALCTAGDTVGEAMKLFEKALQARGLTAESTCSLLMPESYVGLPFMDVDTPEKELLKKQKAAADLQSFIQIVAERTPGYHHLTIGRWPRTNSRLLGEAFERWLVRDTPFHVAEDRCTRCGLCAAVCPVADIEGGPGKSPSWRHNGRCLTCFACYHHCPGHAIEFGGQTRKKGQYYFSRIAKKTSAE